MGDDSRLRELLHLAKDEPDIMYSLAYAQVEPGEMTYVHRLKSSEVY